MKKVVVISVLLVLGISILGIVVSNNARQEAASYYNNLADSYTVVANSTETKNESDKKNNSSKEEEIETVEDSWKDDIRVDVEGLHQKNAEIIGWLFFENEDISYPIMYSGDNEKYLRTDCDGNKSVAGSIFVEGKNDPFFLDKHTLVYGHNMKDLGMFGKLRYYKTDKDYWKDHQYFQVVTSGAKFRYQVISCKDVDDDAEIYRVFHENESANFADFISKNILVGSYINSGYVYKTSDEFITLSTCSVGDKRFIITGVKVDAVFE